MNQTTSTDIAVISESSINLAAATLSGLTFVSEAVLTGDAVGARRITWATGNNAMRAANGKTPLENARGFLLDKPGEDELFPQDYELLDAMELLCAQGKAREVVIEHQDKEGKPNWVPSWQFPLLSLFVVCEGVPTEQAMKDDPECRWGVAYVPYRGRDANDKARSSEVHFGAFVKELMDVGYNGAFMFKFSSYVAPKILACLKTHEYSLRFVNALRSEAGETQDLPYYALALPVQVSVNTITAGTEAGKTKQVHYPIPAIPRLSLRDPQAAMAFVSSVAITRDQALTVEDGGLIEQTARWSIDFSKRMLSGNVVDEAIVPGAPPSDDRVFTDDDIPDSLR
jgi:hypothetical protein